MLRKNLPRTASSVLTALAVLTAPAALTATAAALPRPAAHAAERSPAGREDAGATGAASPSPISPAALSGPELAHTGADGSARVLVGASVVLMTAGASLLVVRRHRVAGRRTGG